MLGTFRLKRMLPNAIKVQVSDTTKDAITTNAGTQKTAIQKLFELSGK
jgi:hypothetical protein